MNNSSSENTGKVQSLFYFDSVNRLVNFSYELALVLLVINILIIFLSLIGNSIVILLVKMYTQLRVPANYLIASLASVDFFTALVFQVSNAINIDRAMRMPHRKPLVSKEGAQFLDVLGLTIFYVNVITVCLITLDRYIAIKHSLRYISIVTTQRVKIAIAISWVVSFIISIASAVLSPVENATRIIPQAMLLVSAFFVVVVYLKIYKISRVHSKSIKAQHLALHPNAQNIPTERRGIKTVAFISISLFGGYLPLTLVALEKNLFSSNQTESRLNAREAFQQIGILFLLGKSAVNPITYFFRNEIARKYTFKLYKSVRENYFSYLSCHSIQ